MAYTFAERGKTPGPARGLSRTVLRVMNTAKKDGRDWVWHRPDGLETVAPRVLGFGLLAAKRLRATKRGDVSEIITSHESVKPELRYVIETL